METKRKYFRVEGCYSLSITVSTLGSFAISSAPALLSSFSRLFLSVDQRHCIGVITWEAFYNIAAILYNLVADSWHCWGLYKIQPSHCWLLLSVKVFLLDFLVSLTMSPHSYERGTTHMYLLSQFSVPLSVISSSSCMSLYPQLLHRLLCLVFQ